ncbi:MAG: carboxypeptidase-like regulatory domain-containing protein [Chloroflexia bacterium]
MKRLLLALLMAGLWLPILSTSAAAPTPLCFPDVPKITSCIEGRFLAYWQENGGLPVFGYPLNTAQPRPTASALTSQLFERNRFEMHPENRPPYDVLLGRLGADRLSQEGRAAGPREAGPLSGCTWFAQTGHNVCDRESGTGFATYWRSHGLLDPALNPYQRSLALFGLPLTAAQMEPSSGGGMILTQWFERARFEYHPEKPQAFKVLLGSLGAETTPGIATGLVVDVTIGPVCPGPDTGDPACADKPYQAMISVLTTARVSVAHFQTDALGHYELTLAPGTYIVVPVSPARYPHASEQTVTVTAGRVTHLAIGYDSGIR